MKDKLSIKEYEEIKQLVDCALTAPNKKEAQKYINELSSYGYSLYGNANIIFNELVCCVQDASGRITDKEKKKYFAESTLYKLESFGVKK